MAKIRDLVVETKRVNYDKEWIATDTTVSFPYTLSCIVLVNRMALRAIVNYHIKYFGGDYRNIRLIECEIISSIDTWGNEVKMSKDTVKNLFHNLEEIEINHFTDFLKKNKV